MTEEAQPPAGPPYGGPYPGPPPVGSPYPVPPAPAREAVRPSRRVEPVPGTPFGVVYLDVPGVTSGLAIGALVAGILSVLVSLLVACFGLVGAQGGWGGWAAGAFVLLGGLTGLAGLILGELGRRQIRRSASPPAVRFTGRGVALSGLICGAVGLGGTVLAFLVAILLQVSS